MAYNIRYVIAFAPQALLQNAPLLPLLLSARPPLQQQLHVKPVLNGTGSTRLNLTGCECYVGLTVVDSVWAVHSSEPGEAQSSCEVR